MPFAMDMTSSRQHPTGKFLIHYNSIIFAFPNNATIHYPKCALRLRNILEDYFDYHHIANKLPLSKQKSFAETEDIRHDFEHISSYDRYHCIHFHVIFERAVDQEIINAFFQCLFDASSIDPTLDVIMSRNNLLSIYRTASAYLTDLTKNNETIEIENEYRIKKNEEYETAKKIKAGISLGYFSFYKNPVKSEESALPSIALGSKKI